MAEGMRGIGRGVRPEERSLDRPRRIAHGTNDLRAGHARTNRRLAGARAHGPGGHAVSRLIKKGPYASHEVFRKIANKTAHGVGHPWAFALAAGTVVVWGVTGPLFHFSDTWQLVINTGTTIVTFLMVFLIQNTQNRDSHAIHLKLDELIRANKYARNMLLAAEELTEEELDELQAEFLRLATEKIERHRDSSPPSSQPPPSSSSTNTGARSSRTNAREPDPSTVARSRTRAP